MLSGIKTGKKRKRPAAAAAAAPSSSAATGGVGTGGIGGGGGAFAASGVSGVGVGGGSGSGGGGNRSAADALRASLLGGGRAAISTSDKQGGRSDVQSRLDERISSYKSNDSAISNLQSRGRISGEAVAAPKNDDAVVVNTDGKSTIHYENEQGVRYNSRGKLSRHAHDQLRQKTEQEMTVEQMAAEERNDASNMDEIYARNVMKMGKGFKKLEKVMGTNSRSGADEEDYQETAGLSNLYRSNDDKFSPAELAARSKSRQIAQHDALSKWTAKSWWWMESPKFDKRYLIALGEKVSLVMTPTHKRLEQDVMKKGMWDGGQCYIVPLSYSESFVGLDEEVWYEVRRFQSSLRQMFQKEGRGVLFMETVTRTSRGGGGTALQAKMEVIPVPRSVERDAPLYFKSALAEVAQEWGTHGNRPITLNETKTLRTAVPKGFPYFYCGWEGGGFVQLIEHEDDGDDGEGGAGGMRAGGGSKRFPRDFGIDTVGGMMDCDPIRFQRKSPARDGDRAAILQFCEKWKAFDWTLELDA